MPLSVDLPVFKNSTHQSCLNENQHGEGYTLLSTQKAVDKSMRNAILLSVGPPSPPASSCCSDLDNQETILQSWAMPTSPPETTSLPNTPPLHGRRDSEDDDTWMAQKRFRTVEELGLQVVSSRNSNRGCISSTPSHSQSYNPRRGSRSHSDRDGDAKKMSELYKTEMCRSVAAGTICRYGDQCQFAHSEEELNQITRHPRYKTQFCTSFQTYGHCKYNDRCTFIHHPSEARTPSMNRKANAQIRAKAAAKTTSNSIAANANHHHKQRSDSLASTGSQLGAAWLDAIEVSTTSQPVSSTFPLVASFNGENSCTAVPMPPVHAAHPGVMQSHMAKGGDMHSNITLPAMVAHTSPHLSQLQATTQGAISVASTSITPTILSEHSSSHVASNASPQSLHTAQLVAGTRYLLGDGSQSRIPKSVVNVTPSSSNSPWVETENLMVENDPPPWLASLGRYIRTPQNEFEL